MNGRTTLPLCAALLLGACSARSAQMPAAAPAVQAAADSLRGIVERTGSEPNTTLVARASNGARCTLRVAHPVPALEGLEVTMWGTLSTASSTAPCRFEVVRFAVRAVDGIAALDGVLRAEGAAYVLELASGERHRLHEVPAALRSQVDARIFWAGPLDAAPAAYGVLSAAR